MRFPRVNNWLIFSQQESGEYDVVDYLNEESYTFGSQIGYFAKHLDGKTDPFSVIEYLSDEEVVDLLRSLDMHNFLRRSRFIKVSCVEYCLTLWTPTVRSEKPIVSVLLNRLLYTLFLPIFIFGLITFMMVRPELNGGMVEAICITGVVIGLLLHELAHMNASIAYEGKVFELGLFLSIPFPGAYVMMDTSAVKGVLKKVQISAAGIEMNLLISGLFFLMAAYAPGTAKGCFYAAIINAELALMNLLLIKGLDGASIISELLGSEPLVESIKDYCLCMLKGARLPSSKKPDMLYSTVFFSTVLFQPVSIVLVILNILGVIAWLS